MQKLIPALLFGTNLYHNIYHFSNRPACIMRFNVVLMFDDMLTMVITVVNDLHSVLPTDFRVIIIISYRVGCMSRCWEQG